MQIKDLNNVPINESASQNPQDERKENYIFWTKSNQPVTDEYPNGKWIWIVGPNYEKKSDKPPDLRNLGKGLEMSDKNSEIIRIHLYNHEDLEKRGGCGVVAHESHVSQ